MAWMDAYDLQWVSLESMGWYSSATMSCHAVSYKGLSATLVFLQNMGHPGLYLSWDLSSKTSELINGFLLKFWAL